MRKLLLALAAIFLMALPAPAQSGLFVYPSSAPILSPITGSTWLFNSSNQRIFCWNGSQFAQVSSPFSNFAAVTNPGSTNDNTQGFQVGSVWINTNSNGIFQCTNATTNSAVWVSLGVNLSQTFLTQAPETASLPNSIQLLAGTNITFTRSGSTITIGSPGAAGTITTTGSPANGNLTKFSGATTITNADLTGDVTTSGTTATTLATVNSNVGSFTNANIVVNAKGQITGAVNGNLNGDLTTSGNTATLATVNSNVGNFTNANITVNAKGLITAASTGSVSGGTVTTTGSPTSGNIATFSSGTSITNANLSGDVSTSGGVVTTLATVNTNVGSFTNANITVDGKGRITAAATGSGGAGTVTTSGSPASGNMAKFSGSTVVTNATAGTDYQAPITLTTTGTSGAATFTSNTLNIPQYTAAAANGQTYQQGRLYITSGKPLSEGTGSNTTIYYGPYTGNQITLSNHAGTAATTQSFSEISATLSALGATTLGKTYDIYINSTGTSTIAMSVAGWSTNTPPTRGTDFFGRPCLNGSPDYLLVGAVTVDGSSPVFYNSYVQRKLSNLYNTVLLALSASNTGTATKTTSAWSTISGNSAGVDWVEFTQVMYQSAVWIDYVTTMAGASGLAQSSIGFDSTTTPFFPIAPGPGLGTGSPIQMHCCSTINQTTMLGNHRIYFLINCGTVPSAVFGGSNTSLPYTNVSGWLYN